MTFGQKIDHFFMSSSLDIKCHFNSKNGHNLKNMAYMMYVIILIMSYAQLAFNQVDISQQDDIFDKCYVFISAV